MRESSGNFISVVRRLVTASFLKVSEHRSQANSGLGALEKALSRLCAVVGGGGAVARGGWPTGLGQQPKLFSSILRFEIVYMF